MPFPPEFKDVNIFEGLSESYLNIVYQTGFELSFGPQETIVEEGSLGFQLYVIIEGKVEVNMQDPIRMDQQIKLATLGPKDVFGELTLFEETSRSASVVTLEPSKLIEFHKADLMEIFQRIPEIERTLLCNVGRLLCERIRTTHELLKQLPA